MAAELTREQRVGLVDMQCAEFTLKAQAELLGLHRSGLYYQPVAVSAEEVAIKHKIDELHTACPFYGSRKIALELGINRKAVQRHMRQMGIAAICPGPNLSRRRAQAATHPYLLGNLTIDQPNLAWGIDITYIRMRMSWMYLVAVMDLFSRFVLAWQMDDTLEMPFVLEVVDRALQIATPKIWNSDQGSHFTSPLYLDRLTSAGVRISMDGKGRAMDNIFVERLWRSVKYEEVYLKDYATPTEARQGVGDYLNFYDYRRIHQALDYRTPAAVYFGSDSFLKRDDWTVRAAPNASDGVR
jgi:putative transposase